ncbi:hypothetical protein ALC60_09476 [Trachymyrmex zeteki]|uniref:Uncharacterized protein n=1 Tax=Mycetomoellerius zeteki TaxID=64791 RepID=A0A151WUK1_9HYME|nr:hypothetical protein ALC60_09476 [Trachymyrmex zeteki]
MKKKTKAALKRKVGTRIETQFDPRYEAPAEVGSPRAHLTHMISKISVKYNNVESINEYTCLTRNFLRKKLPVLGSNLEDPENHPEIVENDTAEIYRAWQTAQFSKDFESVFSSVASLSFSLSLSVIPAGCVSSFLCSRRVHTQHHSPSSYLASRKAKVGTRAMEWIDTDSPYPRYLRVAESTLGDAGRSLSSLLEDGSQRVQGYGDVGTRGERTGAEDREGYTMEEIAKGGKGSGEETRKGASHRAYVREERRARENGGVSEEETIAHRGGLVIDSHTLRPPPPSDPWTLPTSRRVTRLAKLGELKTVEQDTLCVCVLARAKEKLKEEENESRDLNNSVRMFLMRGLAASRVLSVGLQSSIFRLKLEIAAAVRRQSHKRTRTGVKLGFNCFTAQHFRCWTEIKDFYDV